MHELLETLVYGLPSMFAHAGVTVAMLMAGIWLYVRMTPYDDMKLLREGNVASSISFFGIVVGLAIPLSLCLSQITSVLEIVVWGSLTVAIQLFAFKVCDWLLSDLPARIERGEVSAAIVLLAVKLASALINSAMG